MLFWVLGPFSLFTFNLFFTGKVLPVLSHKDTCRHASHNEQEPYFCTHSRFVFYLFTFLLFHSFTFHPILRSPGLCDVLQMFHFPYLDILEGQHAATIPE